MTIPSLPRLVNLLNQSQSPGIPTPAPSQAMTKPIGLKEALQSSSKVAAGRLSPTCGVVENAKI